MREDIEVALASLDRETRGQLTGFKALRNVKKPLEKLSDLVGPQRVIAVAPACDPMQGASDMANAVGSSVSRLRSLRLLVVTNSSFWEVQPGSRLDGSQPQGAELPLAAITDFRTRVDRVLLRKCRLLMVDYQRGAMVETDVHEIMTDGGHTAISLALRDGVGAARHAASEAEDAHTATVIAQALAESPGRSVADEIGKLHALKTDGAITQAEFEMMKANLLSESQGQA